MKYRELGRSGLKVSALGFGCMSLTDPPGLQAGKNEMIRVVRAAVDRGVTFFDTAANLAQIQSAASKLRVGGHRYSEATQKLINR